jgi:biopolymer transport protein ExbD
MAISMNGGNGFGSRRRAGGSSLSEINVTPFVDVVLVLLIIFMLTAHVMDFGIEVDVPKTRIVKETAQEMPTITITKTGNLYLNERFISLDDLKDEIHKRFGKDVKGVYVRADKDTVFEPIATVVSELGAAKFQVNLVTQPEETKGKK